jgi:hypothetical protein
MKSKIKTNLLALAMSPLMLASVLANSTYQYSLQDPQDFGSAFVDSLGLANWQGVDGGPVLPTGSRFSINSTKGLEITSSSPYPTVAAYVWNYLLPLESDWQVEVQAHMENFTPTFLQNPLGPDPFYYTGPTLIFVGNGSIDPVQAFSNRLNWIFVRSLGANGTLENTLQEGDFVAGSGSTGPVAVPTSDDIVLTLRYTSSNRTIATLWRTVNGTDNLVSAYKVDDWTSGGNPPDQAVLALTAATSPLSDPAQFDPNENYSLPSGMVWLKNLKISTAAPSRLAYLPSLIHSGSFSSGSVPTNSEVKKLKKKGGKNKTSSTNKSGSKKKQVVTKKPAARKPIIAKKKSAAKKPAGKKPGGAKKKK